MKIETDRVIYHPGDQVRCHVDIEYQNSMIQMSLYQADKKIIEQQAAVRDHLFHDLTAVFVTKLWARVFP